MKRKKIDDGDKEQYSDGKISEKKSKKEKVIHIERNTSSGEKEVNEDEQKRGKERYWATRRKNTR